ncbi:MAG: thioesterase family protein [Pirellulales bacterium]
MAETFLHQRRVEFCETDAAGIVHFSAFLLYMEQAEHAFFRSLGTSVMMHDEFKPSMSWPRVRVECEYASSARFEDVLAIQLQIAKLGNKSIEFATTISHGDRVVARGKSTSVCCELDRGNLRSIPIPETLRAQFLPFALDPSSRK